MKYINDITNFIFIDNEPEKSDIIFIPGGSHPQIAERAAILWKDNFAPLILPSGNHGIKSSSFKGPSYKKDVYDKEYETEYMFFKDVLLQNGVNEKSILKEDKAEFTFQNAIFSRKVIDEKNLKINKAIICCQAFHARRCLMYYETLFPSTQFFVCPSETQGINKNNWYKNEDSIERVLGEVAKCGIQFKKIIKEYARGNFR